VDYLNKTHVTERVKVSRPFICMRIHNSIKMYLDAWQQSTTYKKLSFELNVTIHTA